MRSTGLYSFLLLFFMLVLVHSEVGSADNLASRFSNLKSRIKLPFTKKSDNMKEAYKVDFLNDKTGGADVITMNLFQKSSSSLKSCTALHTFLKEAKQSKQNLIAHANRLQSRIKDNIQHVKGDETFKRNSNIEILMNPDFVDYLFAMVPESIKTHASFLDHQKEILKLKIQNFFSFFNNDIRNFQFSSKKFVPLTNGDNSLTISEETKQLILKVNFGYNSESFSTDLMRAAENMAFDDHKRKASDVQEDTDNARKLIFKIELYLRFLKQWAVDSVFKQYRSYCLKKVIPARFIH